MFFSDPSGLTPQEGGQEPHKDCPCGSVCVCLQAVEVQNNYKPRQFVFISQMDSGMSSFGLNSGFEIVNNGSGGIATKSITPAGLVALNGAVIQAAMMKNIVSVVSNNIASQPTSNKSTYDSPFFTNQYFAGDASMRVASPGSFFFDLGIKKIAHGTFGWYKESGYIPEYHNGKGTVRAFENSFFEASIAAIYGIGLKYDLNNGWVDSFSLSEYGIGLEFSRLSTWKWQVFIGFETGISGGLNWGGAASGKAGWLIK